MVVICKLHVTHIILYLPCMKFEFQRVRVIVTEFLARGISSRKKNFGSLIGPSVTGEQAIEIDRK